MMLAAPGIGEVAISVSGDPAAADGDAGAHDPGGRRGEPALRDARAGNGARRAGAVRHQLGLIRRPGATW